MPENWIIRTARQKLIAGIYRLEPDWHVPAGEMASDDLRRWKEMVDLFRRYFILGQPITTIAKEVGCTRQNISRRLILFWERLRSLGKVKTDEEDYDKGAA